jgi:hypothetical protein
MRRPWAYTSNWFAVCPACDKRYEREDVACPNCKRRQLVYYQEFTDVGGGHLFHSMSNLRCITEGINIHGFSCECDAAVTMGCVSGFVEKGRLPGYFFSGTARFGVSLLSGVLAAVLIFGLSGGPTRKNQENFVLAALVVGLAAYLYVSRYMRIYHGRKWLRWSNE